MLIRLVWGCNPAFQYESAWIRSLFHPYIVEEVYCFEPPHTLFPSQPGVISILIESGLPYLEKIPSASKIRALLNLRFSRVSVLNESPFFGIIHLSDEEGFDGDSWYPYLPKHLVIWRNFLHSRFASYSFPIYTFPIGPRHIFLDYPNHLSSGLSSSSRYYPWSFMGTLWSSGSRTLAVSTFLASKPNGFFYGGSHFGQGLPLFKYKSILLTSVFSLAPEGDRHLDTFRLWESLCCGCIPLVVDHNNVASSLLPHSFPVPIFRSWHDALSFVDSILSSPYHLDRLQISVFEWWINYLKFLKSSFLNYP